MPTYKIRGINVDFPFEAYDCQIGYMEKVIQSLQERSNALLESPTGTGKTLCLLCATLAWRKSLGAFSTGGAGSKLGQECTSESKSNKLPTIVYTSRTHSQLRQVVKELKRSNYRPKMVVLGSREQLCIHEDVSLLRGRAQNNACRSLCRRRKKRVCTHFTHVAEFMKTNPCLGDEPIDIEDLVNIGKSCGPCPYYMSRELHKVVDILFAPYNYLIDHGNRASLNIEWENSIIIFDEAHNLEGLCADAASFDLPSGLLNACISEAQRCIDLSTVRRDKSNDTSCKPDTFAILKALLKKLETRIAEVPIESNELGFTKPGPYIYEFLGDLNITGETADMLKCTIEEAVVLLEEDSNDSEMGNKTNRTCRLETMGNILKIIFKDGGNDHASHYRVHIQEVESSGSDAFRSSKASRTFSWWCFNPGIAMVGFSKLGVGSIILTSGTLSPMDSFAEELKLDFPIRLENPHVISSNQLWSGIVPVGPSGFPFNSSYRSRDSPEYKQELGNAIVNFARIVPDGLLVFFPSYFLLDQCIGYWKDTGNASTANSSTIWERICKHKLPVVEPRQSSLFNVSINDYMTKLKDTSVSGAIFFAVCRGKVSEGLDFADQAGRAVIVTGIPFATRTDPKVRLKREFMDQQAMSQGKGCKVLTGEEWYSQQASRAVNQAVGRVIRHRHDYGAIIFCDERFANSNRQSQISRWIHPHIKCYSMFGDVVYTLTRFFRDGGTRGPTKLELEQTEDHGNTNQQDSFNPLEKLHLEKLLAPLQKTEFNSTHSESSSSSFLVEVMRGSNALSEILPANRSSLNFYKGSQILSSKHSSDKLTCEKRTVIPPKRNVQYSKNTFVDLTTDISSNEKESKELIVPCSVKKPRLLKTGSDLTQTFENPEKHPVVKTEPLSTPYLGIDSIKCERPHITVSGSTQNAEAGKKKLHGNALTAQKSSTESFSQKNKGVLSSTVDGEDEEKKGATFLTQVKEKLSEPEYKNFVGFMKAMRSKTMKTGFVLQSIVRLFSTPDRLPLLHRFKDYVPAKYQSLYENYAKGNDNDDDSDAMDHLKHLTGRT